MKKYTYKIYQNTGEYITSWSDASFDSFIKTINGGLGECKIKLARKFDDFGENNDVKLNNKVEIIVSDSDTDSAGLVIYSGFISSYSPYVDGGDEGVEVTCLGYVSKLGTTILKNGVQIELKTDTSSGLTTGTTASASKINTVVNAIIDRYRAECLNPKIDDSATSVDTTTQTFTYTFNAKKYNEALDICRQSAPANWWWYVGADNILQFKPKPSLATHNFVFGKHFKKIAVEKNMENVVNRVLFSSSNNPDQQILKLYSDTDSSTDFDDRWEIISDSRVSVSETSDNIGQSELAEKKDADVKVTIEILDNNGNKDGYDIESINPGDTCKFLNLNTITSQTFTNNMTIVSVNYDPDKVIIELATLKTNAGKEIIENKRKIEEQEVTGRATSYDTDSNRWHEVGAAGEPAFENSWSNFEGEWNTAAFMKDSMGFVHLKGLVADGSSTIFTLPVGYRLSATMRFAVESYPNAFGSIVIANTGTVSINAGNNTYIFLDGITFRAEQ